MAKLRQRLQVVVITGPPGVGKSTTAIALSDVLAQHDVAHAMIDMDHLRCKVPAQVDDPRNVQLGLKHLDWLAESYRDAGARLLILVDVVPTEHPHIMFETEIPNSMVTIFRLRLPLEDIYERIRIREPEGQQEWFMEKTALVAKTYDELMLGDFVVECHGRSADDIAREILDSIDPLESANNENRVTK